MSRIGNNPVTIPEGVTISIENSIVTVKGKLGELSQEFSDIKIKIEDNLVILTRSSEHKDHKAKHGLYRALISNMVDGVTTGWTKELELVGVGYRATNQGQKLDLALGYSHNIVLQVVPEVKVETISEKGKNPIVKLTSNDKQLIGQVAAKIRGFRSPEPYKGKGVRFVGEQVRRKAGKSAYDAVTAMIPFYNLFYIKSAFDYLIGYQIMETIKPGILERIENRMEKDYNQHFLFTKPSTQFKGFN